MDDELAAADMEGDFLVNTEVLPCVNNDQELARVLHWKHDLDGNAIDVHGIAENAATTMGRLASVNPNFVAPDLGRFLLG